MHNYFACHFLSILETQNLLVVSVCKKKTKKRKKEFDICRNYQNGGWVGVKKNHSFVNDRIISDRIV